MIILGIETSCDETAAAVLTNAGGRITILSNIVASSASMQAKYGGIIPEQAAREQLRSIIPVIEEALNLAFNPESNSKISNFKFLISKIDAIAVTSGPGLIGSLLVGVETAKTLAMVWHKPLIPINHLLGHFYANWILPPIIAREKVQRTFKAKQSIIEIATSVAPLLPRNDNFKVPNFPCLGLLVSGGHTDLVLFTSHGKYEYLGGTRDDAAGECFDKCARLLGLPYPGGPQISKLAQKGDPGKFTLPIPMKGSKDFDFSYSGLKTAVANIVNSSELVVGSEKQKADLAAAIEETIIISLIDKVVLAAQKYNTGQIMVAGGVAANQRLFKKLLGLTKDKTISLHVPSPDLCTDNGAMIAAAGFFGKSLNPILIQADPNLSLSQICF